uniref:Uncharacterized protein n=1 Tax=Sipha flava TaxID=143950 RepID=A0A2S2QUA8_9HEMI
MSLSKNITDPIELSDEEGYSLDMNSECYYIDPQIEKRFAVMFTDEENGFTRQELYNTIYEKRVNPRNGHRIGRSSRIRNITRSRKSANKSLDVNDSIDLSDENTIPNNHSICFYILPIVRDRYLSLLKNSNNILTVQLMYNKIYESGINPRNGHPIGKISRSRKLYYRVELKEMPPLPPPLTREVATQTKISLAEAKLLDALPPSVQLPKTQLLETLVPSDQLSDAMLQSAQLPEAQLLKDLLPSAQFSDNLLPSNQLPEVQLSKALVPFDQLSENLLPCAQQPEPMIID